MAIFVGVTAPDPTLHSVWVSLDPADQIIPYGPDNVRRVIAKDASYENGSIQEPSVWYYGGKWHMVYGGGPACYASALDPMGPWEKAAAAIEVSGYAGSVRHQSVSLIDGVLVMTFNSSVDTQKFRMATANPAAPTVWTMDPTWEFTPDTAYGTSLGNTFLLKMSDGRYALFFETSIPGATGQPSLSWQNGVAVSDTLTGTYALHQMPIASLGPMREYLPAESLSASAMGNPWVSYANGRYTMYYGVTSYPWAKNDICRATSDDMVHWTVDKNGRPIIRRSTPWEVDQSVDPHLVQGPHGLWWAFWTAYDNVSAVSYIVACQMLPAIKMYDGNRWITINDGGSQQGDQYNARWVKGSSSAKHLDELICDTTSTAMTITLPRAAQGAKVRVINAGPTGGTNAVTVSCHAADTISNAGSTMSVGQVAEYRCYFENRWSRI